MDEHEKTFNLKKKETIIDKKVKNIPDKEKLELLKQGKLFPEVTYEDQIYYSIITMNLLIFLIVLFLLIRCLYMSKSENDNKFIWICIFLFLYPILHLIRAFFEVYTIKD